MPSMNSSVVITSVDEDDTDDDNDNEKAERSSTSLFFSSRKGFGNENGMGNHEKNERCKRNGSESGEEEWIENEEVDVVVINVEFPEKEVVEEGTDGECHCCSFERERRLFFL
jgi:hypothetical protein